MKSQIDEMGRILIIGNPFLVELNTFEFGYIIKPLVQYSLFLQNLKTLPIF